MNELKAKGLQTIGVTTNGIALSRKLPLLKKAGLDQINISLDTLDPFKFELMTRRKGHQSVLDTIYGSLDYGFSPKVNVVVINKINSNEIIDFVNLTKELPLNVRFIEYMPFGGNKWNMDKFVSYSDMLKKIKKVYPDIYKIADDPNDTTKVFLI